MKRQNLQPKQKKTVMDSKNKEAIKIISKETGIKESLVKDIINNFFSMRSIGYYFKRQVEVIINSFGKFTTNARGRFLKQLKNSNIKRYKREQEKNRRKDLPMR